VVSWSATGVLRGMAEYVDGSEKAPLAAAVAGGRRAAPGSKPDWTRFGLQTGGDPDPAARGRQGAGDATTRGDDDAGEVNEIYAEHEVDMLDRCIHAIVTT